MTAADRRRHPRFHFGGPLELRTSGRLQWQSVAAVDVSEGGLSFRTPEPLEAGQLVRVALRAAGSERFVVHARVCHVRQEQQGYFIGIERLAA